MQKNTDAIDAMRLDKWLWCARFYKTRALAAAAIKGNKVRVNDNPIKVAKNIHVGDRVEIRKSPYKYSITVLKLSPNRLPATGAALLYKESPESVEARETLAKQIKVESATFPRTRGRPSKRDRRHIIRFTRKPKSDQVDD